MRERRRDDERHERERQGERRGVMRCEPSVSASDCPSDRIGLPLSDRPSGDGRVGQRGSITQLWQAESTEVNQMTNR